MAYVNCDIILFDDFTRTAKQLDSMFSRYLMIGARIDLNRVHEDIFKDSDWENQLRTRAMETGQVMRQGMDYFVFSKGEFTFIPPFILGRPAYDNWLVWYAVPATSQL